MTAVLGKGWCPGALRPMPAKDGLLVRLRITGGILPAATARALADLAARCGNGLFDLSARANLQMRGVSEATLPALHDGLKALDLLDPNADGEAVRNVMASPLAGLHGGIDIRPLMAALERRLSADAALHALPAKFGFLVDDGSEPSLAGIAADMRFDWMGDAFAMRLAGTRHEAVPVGICGADELVETATSLARGAIDLFRRHPETRRLRDLVALVGHEAVTGFCDTREAPSAKLRTAPPCPAGEYIASFAAPFGRLDTAMLDGIADVAAATTHKELRLTPWRTILVPGAPTQSLPGLVIDRADPRLRIAACVGIEGCAHGTTPTHRDATRLAEALDSSASDEILLHVSGCAKGCAKASPTRLTLVARNGRYDLVRDGRADDPPVARGLDLEAALTAVAAALEPA